MTAEVAAFWSYAHDDNALDGGGIIELAEKLRKEFDLITGDALTLFIDRTGISWGDEWRRRIDGALAETTFFIPVITPRYFTRSECRRELLEFTAQAQSLGVSELILPIRYAQVNNFSDQNPDEAIALVARMQYVDWTQIRLLGSTSPEYRSAVNGLAARLAELASAVAETQLSGELREVHEAEEDALGLMDLLDQINRLLPEWVDALDENQVILAQLDAAWEIYSERIRKAERSASASAQFSLLHRVAIGELPLAERALSIAQIFAAKTIELDPLVLAVARIRSTYPSHKELFTDLYLAIGRAMRDIAKDEAKERSRNYILASKWALQRANVSRAMRKLGKTWDLSERNTAEAYATVRKWATELNIDTADPSADSS